MARYCKSCGSISKTQIPLFIAFNAVFLERSVFLSFCIAQTYIYIYIYIYTDRHNRSLYPAARMRGAG